MSEQKTPTPALKAWLEQLGNLLSETAAGRPVIQKAPGGDAAATDGMFWWTCDGDPGLRIGISKADAESLSRMTEGRDSQATFADLMNRASERTGTVSAAAQAQPERMESYSVQFANGEGVHLAVPRTESGSQAGSNLDVLMDIELPITLRFGLTQMALRDVASLGAGSVIEFDRGVDDPVEIMVNGRVIGRGEAVSVQGAYGVRILEISSRRERLVSEGLDAAVRAGESIQ